MSDVRLDCRDGGERIPLAVPPGRFLMGSPMGLPLELPAHEVEIRGGFLLGCFPMTQAQWTAMMETNPSRASTDPDAPVDSVTWEDANVFCARLGERNRRMVRLPSGAEWEYACRSGSTSEFPFGDDVTQIGTHAWYAHNGDDRSHPVGQKSTNAWGFCDMLGNVWEWCADTCHGDDQGAPYRRLGVGRPPEQPRRVLRGDSWKFDRFRCRSAYRSCEWPQLGLEDFGFRIVVEG